MPFRLALVVLTAVLVSVAPAAAAPRVATTSEGVQLALNGATVTLKVPDGARPGSILSVVCGAGRQQVRGRRRTGVRSGAQVAVRLERPLSDAEWCGFRVQRRDGGDGPRGAGHLEPRLAPPPEPAVAGPGVRSGSDDAPSDDLLSGPGTGRATFDLSGRTLTVRLPAGFAHSGVVFLGCFPFAIEDPSATAIAYAPVDRGQRVITATLVGGDLGSVTGCLLEEALLGGRDISTADLGAPPGPLQTLRLITKDMRPRFAQGAQLVFDLRAYENRLPAVGDIVLLRPPESAFSDQVPRCRTPRAPSRHELCARAIPDVVPEPFRIVLRVVAVAGDRVAFRHGRVIRNGTPERRRGLGRCRWEVGCTFTRPITVPAGHVYLAGDNRGDTTDSRWWGAIPESQVVGRYVGRRR